MLKGVIILYDFNNVLLESYYSFSKKGKDQKETVGFLSFLRPSTFK